jgi:putative FmdB family regulatory protein
MPTYEYECEKGCRFELFQSIKDEPLQTCTRETCPKGRGGVRVQRLLSAAGFILKGGGWYSDGYSSKKGGASDGQGKGPGDGASGRDSGGGGGADSGGKGESAKSESAKSGSGASPASSAPGGDS